MGLLYTSGGKMICPTHPCLAYGRVTNPSPRATKSRSCNFIDFVSGGTPYVTGAIVVVKQHIMHSLFIDF